MKKYSGQAIAIIMVILVVAAVIGASLYSRMIRNKGEVIDTRESSLALEQSGNILDAFIATDIRTLQGVLFAALSADSDNKIEIEGDNIENLESNLNPIFSTIDLSELGQIEASCSKYKMSFEFASLTEGPEYKVGDVMAINLSGITPYPPASCTATLSFTSSSSETLFTVKKVYTDGGTGYKPYELQDMGLYCLSANCPSQSPSSSLETLEDGNKLRFIFDNPTLQEIRVIPLKGIMKIGIEGSTECNKIFDQFLIKATSVCSGQERTMQVIIPSATNYGYDPMFDYTIYNSNGGLNPVVL